MGWSDGQCDRCDRETRVTPHPEDDDRAVCLVCWDALDEERAEADAVTGGSR